MTPTTQYTRHRADKPYIIGGVKERKISFSRAPHQHNKEEDAVAEAHRLSALTGDRFIVFGLVYCTPPTAALQHERKERRQINKVNRKASMCDVLDSAIL